MGKHSPVERIKYLHEQLTYHAHLYFVENRNEISDEAYDALEQELNELYDRYPEIAAKFDFYNRPVPIHEPSGEVIQPVRFEEPMLSLKKALSVEDADAFLLKFPDGTNFFYEEKLDGLALELVYEQGQLVSMSTRGSGLVGEDVTHSIVLFDETTLPRTLRALPGRHKPQGDRLVIRGEGYISLERFDSLNETGGKRSNPRNAVSGWVRSLPQNQREDIQGTLYFAAYYASDRLGTKAYSELRQVLLGLGFGVPESRDWIAVSENRRGNIRPVDGIVIKVDKFKEQDASGNGSKFPHWAIAYKFPAEEALTQVEGCIWNTSRFGRVVPVVQYTPVTIQGVICQCASLDNYGSFMDLGLSIGDRIVITRNNDVIPRLNRVEECGEGDLLEAPTSCPSCDSLLEVVVGRDSSELVCNNVAECPAQIVMRCVTTFDKFGLDVDGLGPVKVSELVEKGWVKQPADILTLPEDIKDQCLTPTTRRGLERVLQEPVPLHRFLKALGIPDIGITLAKRLANAIPEGKIEESLTNPKFLQSVRGVSVGIAYRVVNAFDSPVFKDNFHALKGMLTLQYTGTQDDCIKVCITGNIGPSRGELCNLFAKEGIELSDRLTQDCAFVIVGDRPGKSKLLIATESGIPMLIAKDYSSIGSLIQFIKGHRE